MKYAVELVAVSSCWVEHFLTIQIFACIIYADFHFLLLFHYPLDKARQFILMQQWCSRWAIVSTLRRTSKYHYVIHEICSIWSFLWGQDLDDLGLSARPIRRGGRYNCVLTYQSRLPTSDIFQVEFNCFLQPNEYFCELNFWEANGSLDRMQSSGWWCDQYRAAKLKYNCKIDS